MLRSEAASSEEIAAAGLIYRVSLPPGGGGGQPLVVLLHGRTGDARVMWTFSRVVEELHPAAVSPQGFLEDPAGGYCWWPISLPADSQSGSFSHRKEIHLSAVVRVQKFVRHIIERHGCDAARVVAIGFSQGAGLAAALALHDPPLFAGVALLAGFVPKILHENPLMLSEDLRAGAVKLPKFFIGHGTQDQILPVVRAHQAKAFLEQLGADVETAYDEVGHKVGPNALRGLSQWSKTILASR